MDSVSFHCCPDLKLSEWRRTGSAGLKERDIEYMLALNYAIGPKQTLVNEKQVEVIPSLPGRLYIIEGSVQTPKSLVWLNLMFDFSGFPMVTSFTQ